MDSRETHPCEGSRDETKRWIRSTSSNTCKALQCCAVRCRKERIVIFSSAPRAAPATAPRQNGGFGHRRWHREGASGDGRGRKDGEHHAFVLSVNPTFSRRQRAIHRAMQRGAKDRVGGAKRQMFGLSDESRGGIVDEHI